MGSGKHVNDFTVETNSQCFICSEKVSHGISSFKLEGTKLGSHSIYSLQYLSHYLKIDMRKMFHEEESIPPHLLAQVQKSRLKVKLCEDCGRINETFSRQFKKLEKIEMEIESSLRLIHRKFQKVMNTNKTAQFQNLGVDADDLNSKMEIANALRTEAMSKCKHKLQRPSPLIKIRRLSTREVIAHQFKNRGPTPVYFVYLGDNLAKVKGEVSVLHPAQNDMEEMDYFDDSQSNPQTSDVDLADTGYDEGPLNQPTMPNLKGAMKRLVVRGSVDPTATPFTGAQNIVEVKQYIINPATGKYKCRVCSMEFKKAGFYYHYQSIHLGMKYKCNLCEKKFTRRPADNSHHKTFHKGMSSSFSVVTASKPPVRESVGRSFNSRTGGHQCELCSLEFTSANDLQIHYSSAHPDVKYSCKLCHNQFSQFCAYQEHVCQ